MNARHLWLMDLLSQMHNAVSNLLVERNHVLFSTAVGLAFAKCSEGIVVFFSTPASGSPC